MRIYVVQIEMSNRWHGTIHSFVFVLVYLFIVLYLYRFIYLLYVSVHLYSC